MSSINRAGTLLSNDNYFWLSVISDYAVSDWDLGQIQARLKRDPTVTPEAIQAYLKESLATNSPLNVLMD
jgi:hypothetical protein